MQITLIPLVLLLMQWTVFCADYDDDDDYGYDDESSHEPNIVSTPISIVAKSGEDVILPCDVEDLGDYVVLWKRAGQRILFAGDLRILRDNRFSMEDTSMHITSVEPKDSGEYFCQITSNPPKELMHTLLILSPEVYENQMTTTSTEEVGEDETMDVSSNSFNTISLNLLFLLIVFPMYIL